MHKERQGEIILLSKTVIDGAFYVFVVKSLTSLAPMMSLAWSCLIGAVLFALYNLLRGHWKTLGTKAGFCDAFLGGFINGAVYYLLVYWALLNVSANRVSILTLTVVLTTFVFFKVFTAERVTRQQILGGALIVLGAYITLGDKYEPAQWSDTLVLLAATLSPIANFFQKRALKTVHSSALVGLRLIIVTITCFLLALAVNEPWHMPTDPSLWLLLAFNGVLVLGVSKVMWAEGIKRMAVAKAQSIVMINPVFTLLFSWWLLNLAPTPAQLTAIPIVFLGVYFMTRLQK